MMYRKPCPEGTPIGPRMYRFLEPVKLRLRHPDGTTSLVGYGMDEQIEVLEPTTQYAVVCTDLLKEIPLADGSFIIEYPNFMRVEPVPQKPSH